MEGDSATINEQHLVADEPAILKTTEEEETLVTADATPVDAEAPSRPDTEDAVTAEETRRNSSCDEKKQRLQATTTVSNLSVRTGGDKAEWNGAAPARRRLSDAFVEIASLRTGLEKAAQLATEGHPDLPAAIRAIADEVPACDKSPVVSQRSGKNGRRQRRKGNTPGNGSVSGGNGSAKRGGGRRRGQQNAAADLDAIIANVTKGRADNNNNNSRTQEHDASQILGLEIRNQMRRAESTEELGVAIGKARDHGLKEEVNMGERMLSKMAGPVA